MNVGLIVPLCVLAVSAVIIWRATYVGEVVLGFILALAVLLSCSHC